MAGLGSIEPSNIILRFDTLIDHELIKLQNLLLEDSWQTSSSPKASCILI